MQNINKCVGELQLCLSQALEHCRDTRQRFMWTQELSQNIAKHARLVPYAMRGKFEEELERLVSEGIIEPVQFADWAAPTVPVVKSDGKSLRICGDFKLTVNQASKLDRYPIPKVEDLFARLAGGKAFTKLDMSQAYQQLLLDEESRKYTVINMHHGLFR